MRSACPASSWSAGLHPGRRPVPDGCPLHRSPPLPSHGHARTALQCHRLASGPPLLPVGPPKLLLPGPSPPAAAASGSLHSALLAPLHRPVSSEWPAPAPAPTQPPPHTGSQSPRHLSPCSLGSEPLRLPCSWAAAPRDRLLPATVPALSLPGSPQPRSPCRTLPSCHRPSPPASRPRPYGLARKRSRTDRRAPGPHLQLAAPQPLSRRVSPGRSVTDEGS